MSSSSYDPLTKPTTGELIVATPDHTAHTRSSVPPDDKPTNPLGHPFFAEETAAEPRQRLAAKHNGIAMAINTITCLLANSDTFRDTQAHGMPTEPGQWPLGALHTEGLFAALYFLSQYAESLGHEPLVRT